MSRAKIWMGMVAMVCSTTAAGADLGQVLDGLVKMKKPTQERSQLDNSWLQPAVDTDAYCRKVQANPVIKDYVDAVAQAQTKVTSMNLSQYLMGDKELYKWMTDSIRAKRNNDSMSITRYMDTLGMSANECAIQLRNTNYVYFFEPELSNQGRERLNAYADKLEREASQRKGKSNNFFSAPRDPKDLGNNVNWVPVHLLALEGGEDKLNKLLTDAKDKITVAVDQEMQQNQAQKARFAAEEKKKEDDQKALQADIEKRQKADNEPDAQLLKAYTLFYRVERCYKARQGYATVYINSLEYQDGKTKAKGIETALKPKIKGTADQIWAQAAKNTRSYEDVGFGELPFLINIESTDFSTGMAVCREAKNFLDTLSIQVVGQKVPVKSF
jgi:hypothetical protein